ncbi:MAG: hypothetical protein BroJett031_32230 [Betaproteobacteria bacterium]|nr:MAG: hypothetical protein BroJett031_32230 [Betaproteobacteria bacterium]
MNPIARWIGAKLADYLTRPVGRPSATTSDAHALAAALQPGDVLLVEGNTRISVAIKYLTQSTWSHATLYVGRRPELAPIDGEPAELIEADLKHGVRAVPLSTYATLHTRICRPVGLTDEDRERVIRFAIGRIGHRYDLRNVIDLARYLLRTPPVPAQYRRRLLAFGSGDPTRAICSTLIAQAYQSVRYPILPEVTREKLADPHCSHCYREYLHIRHHSLYAPRDFDISPYFRIVKPTLERGFDYRRVLWADRIEEATPAPLAARSAAPEPARQSTR